MANNDSSKEEKIPIPETVAYYLRTHWCGSKIMHNLIEKNTVSDMQNKLRNTLKDTLKNSLGIEIEL